ncbi:TRAP transporter substrate-binding protein DctP [Xanthobacter sediminis]
MFKALLNGVFAAVLLAVTPVVARAEPLVLKLAHQWPQDEHDYVVAAGVKFAKEVEQRTNGEIKIQFYPAESLVKARDLHVALKTGTVDLAIYPYIYAAGALPELNLILMPGIWKTHEDVYRFRTTPVWAALEDKINAYGFKTLSWIQIAGGVASTGNPIRVPEDVKGLKVRASGKYMELAMKNIGASPVSMPSSEVYNAMQLGLLSGMWTSSSSFGAFRLYEVAKSYVSPQDYSLYFTIEPIAISMRTWRKLTPEQQKILMEVGRSLEPEALAGAKAEDTRIADKFANSGVKVEKLTLDQWNAWQEPFRVSHDQFRQDVPTAAKLLDMMIDEYR